MDSCVVSSVMEGVVRAAGSWSQLKRSPTEGRGAREPCE